jgi:isoleucyl-tRNA synthetase
LDITVTEALQDEGNARELVNRIQRIRKESGLEVTDRIEVTLEESETLKSAIINFYDYICAEILADKLIFLTELFEGTSIEVNESTINISISKKV